MIYIKVGQSKDFVPYYDDDYEDEKGVININVNKYAGPFHNRRAAYDWVADHFGLGETAELFELGT